LNEWGYQRDETLRIGVTRSYCTRHGDGPLVTEDESLAAVLREPHNLDNPYQGQFRVGVLDVALLRYATRAIGGVDGLAMTHLDQVEALPKYVCIGYDVDDVSTNEYFVPGPDGPLVPAVVVSPPEGRQERLGELLAGAVTPRYKCWRSEQELVRIAERYANAPVLLRSYGPTAGTVRFQPKQSKVPGRG
jgi:adenylosuccinate synthase